MLSNYMFCFKVGLNVIKYPQHEWTEIKWLKRSVKSQARKRFARSLVSNSDQPIILSVGKSDGFYGKASCALLRFWRWTGKQRTFRKWIYSCFIKATKMKEIKSLKKDLTNFCIGSVREMGSSRALSRYLWAARISPAQYYKNVRTNIFQKKLLTVEGRWRDITEFVPSKLVKKKNVPKWNNPITLWQKWEELYLYPTSSTSW